MCLGLLCGCGPTPRNEVTPETVAPTNAVSKKINHPIEQLGPGFAGSASCKECHTDEYGSWYDSYHRTMTTLATPETVQGNFSNQVTSAYGTICIMDREGDEYWIEMQGTGQTVRRQIKMITGSHHMQVYWFPTDNMRVLGMAPVVYLNEDQQWIPRDAAFLKAPKKKRTLELFRWSVVCIRCHTTGGVPGFAWEGGGYETEEPPNRMDTHASEFGISCEACHGPGAVHVAMREKFGDGLVDDDPMIVPTDLNPELSSQACGQCHSIRLFEDDEAIQHFVTNGMEFCVGMTLKESGQHVWQREDGMDIPAVDKALAENVSSRNGYFWPDGMVRVSGREYNGLIRSPCYTHGDPEKQMSCFDCHQMHQSKNDTRPRAEWADDQLKPGMREGTACIKCHSGFDSVAHTHHAPESSGSNCLNCHMPYTTYGLLKAMRSHTISSPSVQESVSVGRPNACNQCHLDKSLGWAGEKLEDWYGIDSPKLNDKQQAVPASLIWLYSGDAGLRALTAWSMGWDTARDASGADWMSRPLIDRMNDEYDAVRYIAYRSLKKHPGFADFSYDFMAPSPLLIKRMRAAHAQDKHADGWRGLIDHDRGSVSGNVLESLSLSRDLSDVELLE